MANASLVIAYTTQDEETERYFHFPSLKVFVKPILNFLKSVFTKKRVIKEAEYSRIYSVTEKGLEKVEEMPKNITLFISQPEDFAFKEKEI